MTEARSEELKRAIAMRVHDGVARLKSFRGHLDNYSSELNGQYKERLRVLDIVREKLV